MRRFLPILMLLLASCAKEPRYSPRLEAYFRAQKTGICEVHHVAMVGRVVEKYYGLEVHSDEFAAAGWQFPHANASVNGGCEVPARREKAHVYVCPKCKAAERQWALQHPKNPDSEWILEETKT